SFSSLTKRTSRPTRGALCACSTGRSATTGPTSGERSPAPRPRRPPRRPRFRLSGSPGSQIPRRRRKRLPRPRMAAFHRQDKRSLLRLHLLEEHVLLRMGLAGDRIQRVHRLGEGVAVVAPGDVNRAIARRDALVLAERVTYGDLPVVVGRPEDGRVA